MKKWTLFIIALLFSVSLIACRGGDLPPEPEPEPEPGEVVSVTFWNNLTGADGVVMRAMINQFNTEHSDTIQVVETYVNEITHYGNIDLLVPMGRGPDVALMHSHRIPGYVNRDMLLPIEPYLDATDVEISFTDYVENVMNSLVFDDQKYGIPLDLHTVGIYYNKDLLAKYNLDVPTNRAELINAAITVEAGENRDNFWSLPLSNVWPSEWAFTTSLFQNGGSEVAGTETPAYDNATGVKAMKAVADLIHVHNLSPSTIGVDQDLFAFQQGNALFHIQGSWMLNAIKDSGINFGIIPMSNMFTDEDTETKNQIYARSHTFVLPKPSQLASNAKRQAIMTFIKYLGDHSYIWAAAGQIPASNIARENQEYIDLEYIHDFGNPDDFRVSAQTPYYQEAFGTVYASVTSILSMSASNVPTQYTDQYILEVLEQAAEEGRMLIAALKE